MGRTLQEILTARDTLISLWPVISLKKSVLHPVKQIRFLILIIYAETMTLAPSEKKIKYVSQRCQETFTQRKTSILNLTKLNVIDCLSHFTSTNPVSMHLTGTNIRSTEKGVLQWSCDTSEFMVHGKLSTLQWEKTSAKGTPYDYYSHRCQKVEGILRGSFDRGKRSKEKHIHINVLKLLALKFAILTFTKYLADLTFMFKCTTKLLWHIS